MPAALAAVAVLALGFAGGYLIAGAGADAGGSGAPDPSAVTRVTDASAAVMSNDRLGAIRPLPRPRTTPTMTTPTTATTITPTTTTTITPTTTAATTTPTTTSTTTKTKPGGFGCTGDC